MVTITGKLGGDIGTKSRIHDLPLAVESLWSAAGVPLLHFASYLVHLHFLQSLVAIDIFHHFFNFLESFPVKKGGPNKIGDKQHDVQQRRERKQDNWQASSSNQLTGRGGGQNKNSCKLRAL
jgi:hypothetical protein